MNDIANVLPLACGDALQYSFDERQLAISQDLYLMSGTSAFSDQHWTEPPPPQQRGSALLGSQQAPPPLLQQLQQQQIPVIPLVQQPIVPQSGRRRNVQQNSTPTLTASTSTSARPISQDRARLGSADANLPANVQELMTRHQQQVNRILSAAPLAHTTVLEPEKGLWPTFRASPAVSCVSLPLFPF
ncbi:hypothetical protein Pelo_6457 [Pelomyxa schiedti]|nr:hypothetical protein Pelo_6457 [Pelomyxa schiedti]